MITISRTYTLKWRFKSAPHIQISEDRHVINTITGRIVNECVNGGSYGFWIGQRFVLKSKVNDSVEIIPQYNIPF
jgi:hypothetical protein